VGRLGRKGIGVVFANDTQLAVNEKQRVAVEVQPGRELASVIKSGYLSDLGDQQE
jgi:hypothetical protein